MICVVEYHIAGNEGTGQFFPGANDTAETHPTFILADECSISAPTPVAAIGFPVQVLDYAYDKGANPITIK